MKYCFSLFFLLSLVSTLWAQEEVDEILKEREKIQQSAPAQAGLQIDESLQKIEQFNFSFDPASLAGTREQREKMVASFAQNPLRELPSFELRQMIFDKTQGKFIGRIFERHPDTLNCVVAILQDEKALHQLMKILLKEEELKKYALIVMGILVIFWLIKFFILNKIYNPWVRFFSKTLLSLSYMPLTLGIFYFLFQEEVGPTLRIIISYI